MDDTFYVKCDKSMHIFLMEYAKRVGIPINKPDKEYDMDYPNVGWSGDYDCVCRYVREPQFAEKISATKFIKFIDNIAKSKIN